MVNKFSLESCSQEPHDFSHVECQWQVLNAKDYGIPQNRERVFCVSILGEHEPYEFPEKQPLTIVLKDLLEENVDEKFYLSKEIQDRLTIRFSKDIPQDELNSTVKSVGNTNPSGRGMNGNVYDSNYLSPTITTNKGEGARIAVKEDEEPYVKEVVALIGSTQKNAGITDGTYSTTLTSAMGVGGGHIPMVQLKSERIGGIFDKDGKRHQAGAIWDKEQLAPTLDTMQGGWRQPSIIDDTYKNREPRIYNEYSPSLRAERSGLKVVHSNIEPLKIKNATKKGYLEAEDGDGVDLAFPDSQARRGRVQKGMSQTLDTAGGNSKGVVIAASRGRYVNGRSGETEQQLEINDSGTTNTITTVQKDNYVIEPKEEFGRMGRQAVETMKENDVYHGDTINPFYKKVSSNNGVSPTLTTRPEGFKTAVSVVDQYRIRKLTPKECWRLMGCSDEDFHKAEQVNSNTQLYKQAGNAIVVDVLEGIFSKLFF